MNLVIPTVGNELGPQYAFDVNNSLSLVDQHDHTSGRGVQIPPAGLNINSNLTFLNNFAVDLAGTTFNPQTSVPADGTIYVNGVDLYYVDELGNNIRITQSGAVTGTPGSIANLTSPASATYVAGSSTFVWQSNANIAANMDFGAAIMRNLSPNSTFALTLQPPTLTSNYSITLPYLPSTQSIMTLDAAGNMAAPYTVDNSSIIISSNVIEVGPGGITAAMLSSGAINSVVPSGVITAYGGVSAPTGYLMCDGTSYLRATYPNLFTAIGTAYGTADSTHFNVPDLRGLFPRGTDNGAGNDPDTLSRTAQNPGGNTGDNVGSLQADAFENHIHASNLYTLTGGGPFVVSGGQSGNAQIGQANTTTATGSTSTETRPKNVYVNYIIKT
jgi:microcystin-dependent protein